MTLPDWLRLGRDPTDAEWDAYQAESFRRSIQRDVEMQRETEVAPRDPWDFPRRDA